MSIFRKSFDDISFGDIELLISEKIPEGQSVEYKERIWGRGDEDVREMLKDICSMANAYGGYFIMGIKENKDSIAEEICNIENAEDEQDRIFGSLLSNTEPRIPSFNIKVLGNGEKSVLVIHIARSLRAPHMITFKGLNQFWIRHDRQKKKMSVEEIKDNFLKTAHWLGDTKSFFKKQHEEVLSEIGPIPYIVLGALPLGLLNEEFVNIGDINLRDKLKKSPGDQGGDWNFSFDNRPKPSFFGIKIGGQPDPRTMELHRNGYLEARVIIGQRYLEPLSMASDIPPEDRGIKIIHGIAIVKAIDSFLRQVKNLKQYFAYEGQYLITLSLFNIQGFGLRECRIGTTGYYVESLGKWHKQNLEFKPFVFEDIIPGIAGKEICDRIWQAFGFESTPYYENDELKGV